MPGDQIQVNILPIIFIGWPNLGRYPINNFQPYQTGPCSNPRYFCWTLFYPYCMLSQSLNHILSWDLCAKIHCIRKSGSIWGARDALGKNVLWLFGNFSQHEINFMLFSLGSRLLLGNAYYWSIYMYNITGKFIFLLLIRSFARFHFSVQFVCGRFISLKPKPLGAFSIQVTKDYIDLSVDPKQ